MARCRIWNSLRRSARKLENARLAGVSQQANRGLTSERRIPPEMPAQRRNRHGPPLLPYLSAGTSPSRINSTLESWPQDSASS